MDYLKLLRAFLAKVYKMQDGDIDAILEASKEDQGALLTALIDKDKTRVSELTKPKEGQTFQDGYKKAKKELMETLEKEIKDKYDIESDAQGLDLIDQVLETKAKPGKAKELTDDDVRKTPAFITAEKAHKAALKQAQEDAQKKIGELESKFSRTQVLSTAAKKAIDIRNGMNPAVPKDPKVAANLEKAFLKTLEDYDYETAADGSFILMKEGKVVQDAHGHNLDFDSFVKDQASGYYEFQANNGGANPGAGGQQGGGAAGGAAHDKRIVYPAGIQKPKTEEEYFKILNDGTIPVNDRVIVSDVWKQEQKTGTPA